MRSHFGFLSFVCYLLLLNSVSAIAEDNLLILSIPDDQISYISDYFRKNQFLDKQSLTKAKIKSYKSESKTQYFDTKSLILLH